MRRTVLYGLVLLLVGTLVFAPPVAAKGSLDKSIAKQKAKIVAVYAKLITYLVNRDLKAEANLALERIVALDPDQEGETATLAGTIEALKGEGTASAADTKTIEKAHRDAAKGYDKLAGVFAKEKDDPRFSRWLTEAIALDPSSKRKKKFAELAKKGMFLVRTPTHEAAAYLSFPKSWKPGKTWPVLVGVDGAGANFKGCANRFTGSRGKRPFIVISPHALSCTNEIKKARFPAYGDALIKKWSGRRTAFDVPGLLALLDFLHEHFGAGKKIAITGFSGGGNLCYGFTFKHPDRVMCAAPACANFLPQLASGGPEPEEGGPPVHVMTGEKDPHRYLTHGKTPPGIEEQTDNAMKAFEDNGFKNVKRTMLPGVGHSALPRQVWEFVDEVMGK